VLLLLLAALLQPASDWAVYGGSSEGIRYSPLTQINRTNVKQLRLVWSYDTGERETTTETQPIVVNGVLYGITPTHAAIALNAATGKLLWRFDPATKYRGPNRAVVYWADGPDRRVFLAAGDYLYALDALRGQPIASFGQAGRIDLREGLGRDPKVQSVYLTSPGIIYKDLLIIGGRVGEFLPASPGHIRAYDVRTGKLRWTFHTIPYPGEYGYDTWPAKAWIYSGGANDWAGMALDEKRGIVYAPTGSASSDYYGADRVGDNLFANTLLAIDADTGRRIWHFQAVKHDIWDRDLATPPSLVTIHRNGRTIDAVAQATKQGFLFLFERITGKSLFPIEYRGFPPSNVPGELTAATQPVPTKPEPFARQALTTEMVSDRTPEVHKWAREGFQLLRGGGPFVPPGVSDMTLLQPGFDGGANWGGCAFDPQTELLYVNSNDVAATLSMQMDEGWGSGKQVYLRNCAACHGNSLAGTPPEVPSLVHLAARRNRWEVAEIMRHGAGRMPAFPGLTPPESEVLIDYVLTGEDKPLRTTPSSTPPRFRFGGYNWFRDPQGYPASKPPWGTLNAINLSTGEYAWKIPLGEYPELAAKGMKSTGTENLGGPVVTAGGLVFIAATIFDRKFRAFDKLTGELLWETTLPFAGNATPAVYEVSGREFVVIYASGHFKGRPYDPRGGIYAAFALP
jgi:quinoprotein glucose dehydrogenase